MDKVNLMVRSGHEALCLVSPPLRSADAKPDVASFSAADTAAEK